MKIITWEQAYLLVQQDVIFVVFCEHPHTLGLLRVILPFCLLQLGSLIVNVFISDEDIPGLGQFFLQSVENA